MTPVCRCLCSNSSGPPPPSTSASTRPRRERFRIGRRCADRLLLLADTSHVPCKFFRQGACQAGTACPFSHDLGSAAENICKYFAKVSCFFRRAAGCVSAALFRHGHVLLQLERRRDGRGKRNSKDGLFFCTKIRVTSTASYDCCS